MPMEQISGKLSKGKLDMNGSDIFERRYSYPFRPEYAGVYQKIIMIRQFQLFMHDSSVPMSMINAL